MTPLSTITTEEFLENVRRELEVLLDNYEDGLENETPKELVQHLLMNVECFQKGTLDPDVELDWSWDREEWNELDKDLKYRLKSLLVRPSPPKD